MAPLSSMRRVKKACVSSSTIPSRWSTHPSRVTLRLNVRSPMRVHSPKRSFAPTTRLPYPGSRSHRRREACEPLILRSLAQHLGASHQSSRLVIRVLPPMAFILAKAGHAFGGDFSVPALVLGIDLAVDDVPPLLEKRIAIPQVRARELPVH